MPILEEWKLSLDEGHILRAQGANPDILRKRRPALVEIAAWALKEGLPLLQPTVIYRKLAVQMLRHERLELAAGGEGAKRPYISGRLIGQHLGPAEQLVVMVCTLGSTLEDLASELMATDPLHGWALDSLGSAAVEALATSACNYFEAQAFGQGMQTSLPLSPGMIGWPVDQGQAQIFELLEAEQTRYPSRHVRLTSSSQMIPRKSLSLVLGIGKHAGSASRTCDFCSMKETCRYQNHYG